MSFLIIIVVLFALMWLFLIRPQRRRQTETAQMLAALDVGDEIVTAGGLYGRVTQIGREGDDDLHVEIADGIVVRVARRAVVARIDEAEDDEELEDVDELEAADDERAAADETQSVDSPRR